MKAIINGIQELANGIVNVVEFIINIVKNQTRAFQVIAKVASESMELINDFPDYLQIFATITIMVSFIYLILGWSVGKSGN